MRKFSSLAAASLLTGLLAVSAVHAAESADTVIPEHQQWSFAGVYGHYDKGQLQRGFKVFKEVCSQCHQASQLVFRNLDEEGGPEFSKAQVAALAATFQVQDGPNDAGDMFKRPGRPSDNYPWNFANENAAKAALGALPPDMSELAKARTVEYGFPWFLIEALPFFVNEEQGPDYIYALLTKGYVDPPKGAEPVPNGFYYNAVIQGTQHRIKMPNPLAALFNADGSPQDPKFYTDGTVMTQDQVARDVSAFLMWAAEPKLEERKKFGFRVMTFLVVLAGLLYFVKKKVWAGLKDESPAV
ncbi:MAG: cytochrome c1 [Hyphomicrobiales bacterium]|nr:cytochrome c1 [Hyphomicrobiales bacterium]MDE2113387.1 cytochrome c1 [Hyphomicrobiales bacterium]